MVTRKALPCPNTPHMHGRHLVPHSPSIQTFQIQGFNVRSGNMVGVMYIKLTYLIIYLSMYLSVFLSFSISIHLTLNIYIYISNYLSILHLSICTCIHIDIYIYTHTYVYIYIYICVLCLCAIVKYLRHSRTCWGAHFDHPPRWCVAELVEANTLHLTQASIDKEVLFIPKGSM